MHLFIMINIDSSYVRTYKLYSLNSQSMMPPCFKEVSVNSLWMELPDHSGIIPMDEKWDGKSILVPTDPQPVGLDAYELMFEEKR